MDVNASSSYDGAMSAETASVAQAQATDCRPTETGPATTDSIGTPARQ